MDVETECERLVERLADRGSLQRESTAEALRPVPRHEFVPAAKRDQASHDRPLPIGAGQTISAPHMVAMMVDELDLELGDRVLEIGTGCGYHAAVTAEVVGDGNVYSVEYVAALADERVRHSAGSGTRSRSVSATVGRAGPSTRPTTPPYLTCAADEPPAAVLDQFRDGGIFLGPIGRVRQQLVRLTVRGDTHEQETFGDVRVVRMQG